MRPADLPVTHAHAQVNGLRYHYVELGSGPLVLLLHGFPENWWSWRYQLEPLARAGFRVVAPDQRGYADTDKTGPYDLDTLATDLCELIRVLGREKADVVGHDWGGAVAWHMAATRRAFVDRLAVLNCPHPARMAEALRSSREQLKRSWYMLALQIPYLPERALRAGGPLLREIYARNAKDRSHFSEEELRPIIDGLRKPGAAKAMVGWYRTAFREAVKGRWRLGQYPEFNDEALLIWAKEDRALGYDELVPGTERYARKLRVETIERCGHFVQAEQPARVNELLLGHLTAGRRLAPGKVEARPAPARVARAAPVAARVEGPQAFKVVLAAAGDNKIAVIREVREITGLTLKEARELVEGAPRTIKEDATRQEAERLRGALAAAGATVEISRP